MEIFLFAEANKSSFFQARRENFVEFIWEYRSRNFFVNFS